MFTDGDLSRAILKFAAALLQPVCRFASHPCHSLWSDSLIAEAMNLFAETRTEDLPIVERGTGKVVGMLCLKDLSRL